MIRRKQLLGFLAAAAAVPVAAASFSYSFFFGDTPAIVKVGAAAFSPGTSEILLTSGGGQAGAIWQESKQDVGSGFITTFRFRIGPGSSGFDGDGFAFVLHDAGAGVGALGTGGSGLGYDGIHRSLAVEFDTFGFGSEFGAPHVSVQSLGLNNNSSADSASLGHATLDGLPFDILDNRMHTGAVQYRPPTGDQEGHMEVFINSELVLSIPDINLRDIGGGDITDDGFMYAGFTAGTGLADSTHAINAWGLEEATPACVSPFSFVSGGGHGGEGSTFEVHSTILGTRPIEFVWSHNGVEITDDQNGRIQGLGTDALRVHDIELADQGTYRLDYSNDCGSGFNEFILDLPDPPACDPDFNCDGNADQDDVACLIDAVAGNPGCECQDPDFNQDGNVDQDDVAALINVVAGGACP